MKLAIVNLLLLGLVLVVVHGGPVLKESGGDSGGKSNTGDADELIVEEETLPDPDTSDSGGKSNTGDADDLIVEEETLPDPDTSINNDDNDADGDDEKQDLESEEVDLDRERRKAKNRRKNKKNKVQLNVVDHGDEPGGVGKAGGCDDFWSQNKGSIMCTGKDNKWVDEYGITADQKDFILSYHNKLRGQMAASNMMELHWDERLSQAAQKLAQTCVEGHDTTAQRKVPDYAFGVGQNLAFGYAEWKYAIKAWYDEIIYFSYGGNNDIHQVGHFTQVVQSKASKIGCGYANCKNNRIQKFYVCNYAYGQTSKSIREPYFVGAHCEDCPDKCDDTNLCNCGANKACQNGGALNLDTCKCDCPQQWADGDVCKHISKDWKKKQCSKGDNKGCCSKGVYIGKNCKKYTNLPTICPLMCGICAK